MIKFLKYGLLFLLIVFGILQFFRGEYPENRFENPGDITNAMIVSPEVSGILRSACYDCHSMETKYPWYANIAPISWLLIDHIVEGRDELNFSDWEEMTLRRKVKKMKEIAEKVENGEMPMKQYIYLHSEASLTDEQRQLLINWANQSAKELVGD